VGPAGILEVAVGIIPPSNPPALRRVPVAERRSVLRLLKTADWCPKYLPPRCTGETELSRHKGPGLRKSSPCWYVAEQDVAFRGNPNQEIGPGSLTCGFASFCDGAGGAGGEDDGKRPRKYFQYKDYGSGGRL